MTIRDGLQQTLSFVVFSNQEEQVSSIYHRLFRMMIVSIGRKNYHTVRENGKSVEVIKSGSYYFLPGSYDAAGNLKRYKSIFLQKRKRGPLSLEVRITVRPLTVE